MTVKEALQLFPFRGKIQIGDKTLSVVGHIWANDQLSLACVSSPDPVEHVLVVPDNEEIMFWRKIADL